MNYTITYGNLSLEQEGNGKYNIIFWCSDTLKIFRKNELVFKKFFSVDPAPLSVSISRSRESGDTLNFNDLDKASFAISLKNYDISLSAKIIKVEGYFLKNNNIIPFSIDTPNKYNSSFSIPVALAMDIRKVKSPRLVLIFTSQFCDKPIRLAPFTYYLK